MGACSNGPTCSAQARTILMSQNISLVKDSPQQAKGAVELPLRTVLVDFLRLLPKALRRAVERTTNAEASFAEQERAQITLNSIGDAVVSTNVRGQVTYLNAAAERMMGWSRDEVVGRPL